VIDVFTTGREQPERRGDDSAAEMNDEVGPTGTSD
jgi:hypothetical protein